MIHVADLEVGGDGAEVLLPHQIDAEGFVVGVARLLGEVGESQSEGVLLAQVGFLENVAGMSLVASHDGGELDPHSVAGLRLIGGVFIQIVREREVVFEETVSHLTPGGYLGGT